MVDYCSIEQPKEFLTLKEIAQAQRKGFPDTNPDRYPNLMNEAEEQSRERKENLDDRLKDCEEELERHEDELFYKALDKLLTGGKEEDITRMIIGDDDRQKLKGELTSLERKLKEISKEDIDEVLNRYEELGFVDRVGGKTKITSRGAKILGSGFLEKIMENLTKKGSGTHIIEETGHGANLTNILRRYELGDPYENINVQKTLINALERGGRLDRLEMDDFEVHESLYQTKMNTGIMIDMSGSMKYGRKIEVAIETALALSDLIRSYYPEDILRVYKFSEEVEEISYWDIPNLDTPMGWTDIREAIRTFRSNVINEDGDKQAYLITDSEPNFENGVRVGFTRAVDNLLKESIKCRDGEITLNIIMLDQKPHLTRFASTMAKRNLGRVLFTEPQKLGEAIIEDYITSRRERISDGYNF